MTLGMARKHYKVEQTTYKEESIHRKAGGSLQVEKQRTSYTHSFREAVIKVLLGNTRISEAHLYVLEEDGSERMMNQDERDFLEAMKERIRDIVKQWESKEQQSVISAADERKSTPSEIPQEELSQRDGPS